MGTDIAHGDLQALLNLVYLIEIQLRILLKGQEGFQVDWEEVEPEVPSFGVPITFH